MSNLMYCSVRSQIAFKRLQHLVVANKNTLGLGRLYLVRLLQDICFQPPPRVVAQVPQLL